MTVKQIDIEVYFKINNFCLTIKNYLLAERLVDKDTKDIAFDLDNSECCRIVQSLDTEIQILGTEDMALHCRCNCWSQALLLP